MKNLKIIVTQLGRIGDMILLTPVFSALKDKFSDSFISVITSKHNHFVLKNNPNIDKILVYDKKFLSSLKLIAQLRKYKYDFLVDPKDHFSRESQLFARIVRAENKIGFNNKKGNFDIEIQGAKQFTHYTRKMFNAFAKIGIDNTIKLPKPELFESEDSKVYAKDFKNKIQSDFNIVNISASNERKMWQKEKWIKFINNATNNLPFVITFAPSEYEMAIEIENRTSNSLLFKSRSLLDVISIARLSNIIITIDTAMVHISAAWNKDLIGLFGGLDREYEKFMPLNDNFIALRNPKGVGGVQKIEVGDLLKAFDQIKAN